MGQCRLPDNGGEEDSTIRRNGRPSVIAGNAEHGQDAERCLERMILPIGRVEGARIASGGLAMAERPIRRCDVDGSESASRWIGADDHGLAVAPAEHDGVDVEQPGRFRTNHFGRAFRSEEHTSELQSLMRISYAVFCLNKKKNKNT